MIYAKAGTFNTEMVIHGALWYVISCIGFICTFSETLDYYFLFDDLFMVSTAFSLFYSWQSYELDMGHKRKTIGLTDVPGTLRAFAVGFRDEARAKRDLITKQAVELMSPEPLRESKIKLDNKVRKTTRNKN